MLKVSLEELSALNLILKFTSTKDLIAAASYGFAELGDDERSRELSDLCRRILKTLRD